MVVHSMQKIVLGELVEDSEKVLGQKVGEAIIWRYMSMSNVGKT